MTAWEFEATRVAPALTGFWGWLDRWLKGA